ncbi:MAG: hypothetical protein HS132_06165 [Planctomycetia bacterium]|nr:hypothetical protein [Planctomycetia bacterium]
MVDDMLWILLVRMMERVLAVGIGGISIYLGFRLFALMPDMSVGDADIKLPGGVSILLSRVGPGVFFSLFGAVIASLSLYKPVELPVSKSDGSVVMATAAISDGEGYNASLKAERGQVERILADLEQVATLLPPNLDPLVRLDAVRAVRAGRIALIYSVWGPDWGDFHTFKRWAESGSADAPSGALWATAAEMFNRRNPP